ncbi:hypothetical protein [Brevibacillus centrosporus]|uniref:hypothetical protein n=1 Tax=Brevibacillus centrosporus TaxID=54910 RepID=UPI002E22AF10|nr:hypothetical protein [Brevibacillus centrosporus]
MQNNEWPEILTESIVYGLLFKAVARDADSIDFFELKMSYRPILDAISTWSERKHHEYRRKFAQLGGKIHVQESPDKFIYRVLVTVRGYQHERFYNKEILRAECQVRLDQFLSNGIK